MMFIRLLGASITISASCGFTFHSTAGIRRAFPSRGIPTENSSASCNTIISLPTKIQRTCMSSPLSADQEKQQNNLRTKRRRVRRKDDGGETTKTILDEDDDVDEEDEDIAAPETQNKNDGFEMIEVTIRNIRDMGGPAVVASSSMDTAARSSEIMDTAVQVGGLSEPVTNSDTSGSSLESLLADAKRLRAAKGGSGNTEEGVGDKIINVLSTIVTFDFFVVCGLLLWFIAGVFCSYIIKDDTVQIAFNGIFQPVVQPALGILMIGSAASAVLTGKQGDDNESDKKNVNRGN